MKNRLKNRLLVLVVLTYGLNAKAQFPVQVMTQLVAPYSLKLTDYYLSSTPKLYVTLTNRDFTNPNLSVKLNLKIVGNNVEIKSNPNAVYTPIELIAGVPQRMYSVDISQYFDLNNLLFSGLTKEQYLTTGKLPEGLYYFCFSVYDANTNELLSAPEQCAVAWISLGDPPILNLPQNNSEVSAREPTNIVFNWSPRHLNSPNAASNTEYEFQLVELLDNYVDPNAGFQSSKILYSTTTRYTNLIYGPAQPQLIKGKRYAWRVQVKPISKAQEFDEYRNNGFSDVYSFTYTEYCQPILRLQANVSDQEVSFSWAPIQNVSSYFLHYQLSDSHEDSLNISNQTSASLTKLVANGKYVYWLTYTCSSGVLIQSGKQKFTVPSTFKVNGEKPSNLCQQNKKNLTGNVFVSYYNNGLEINSSNQSILVNSYSEYKKEAFNYNENVNTKLPFEGAEVNLFHLKNGVEKLIEKVSTDINGKFSMNVQLETCDLANYYFKINDLSGMVNETQISLDSTKLIGQTIYTEAILFLKSFEIKPTIFSPYSSSTEKTYLEVWLSKLDWDKMYMPLAKVLQVNDATKMRYNNNEYVLIDVIKNGGTYKKLLQNLNNSNGYLFKTVIKDIGENTEVIEPIKDYTYISKCFKTQLYQTFKGKITFKNKPVSQAVVSLLIENPNDFYNKNVAQNETTILSNNNGFKTINYFSNNDGEFTINIPRLLENAVVKIKVEYFQANPDSYIQEVRTSKSLVYTTDIDLKIKYYSYIGFVGKNVGNEITPIANALVALSNSNITTKTSQYGYFVISSTQKLNGSLTISNDGFENQTINVSSLQVVPINYNNNLSIEQDWADAISKLPIIINFTNQNPTLKNNSELFGKTTGILANTYNYEVNVISQQIDAIVNVNPITLTPNKNSKVPVEFSVKYKNNLIALPISLQEINSNSNNPTTQIYTEDGKHNTIYLAANTNYNLSIRSFSNYIFKPINSNFKTVQLGNNLVQKIEIVLEPAIVQNIKIISSKSNLVIPGCSVVLEGNNQTLQSDNNGNVQLIIGENEMFSISFSKQFYKEKIIKGKGSDLIDYSQILIDTLNVNFEYLSGFPIQVSQYVDLGNGQFNISGKLRITPNKLVNVDTAEGNLLFKDVVVKKGGGKNNYFPISDVVFENGVLKADLFNYIPIEINNPKLTKAINSNDYSKAEIGAEKINARIDLLDFENKSLSLGTSSFIDLVGANTPNEFKQMFAAPNQNVDEISNNNEYALSNITGNFNNKDLFPNYNSDKDLLKFNVNGKNSIINKNEIAFSGNLDFDNTLTKNGDNNNQFPVKKLAIKRDLSTLTLAFDVSNDKPYYAGIDKLQTKITSVNYNGFGTNNGQLNVGGEIWFWKKEKSSLNTLGVVKMNGFKVIPSNSEIHFSGKLELATGLPVQQLNFKPTVGNVDFAYYPNILSYEIATSGTLDFNLHSKETSVIDHFFPLEIEAFKLKTSDFTFFLKANAEAGIEVGPVAIGLNTFILNIGSSATLSSTDEMLDDISGNYNVPKMSDGVPLENDKVNWIVGIGGSVETSIKELTCGGGGTVLFGMENNQFKWMVKEIQFKLEKGDMYAFDVAAKFSNNDTRNGFEASGTGTFLKNTVSLGFKYYKYSNKNIECGATIGYEPKKPFVTGPVEWFRVGGGFDYNQNNNSLAFWINGQASVVGMPREIMYVDAEKLGILFQTKDCGAVPVIEGNAKLYLTETQAGEVNSKIDFCKNFFLLSGNVALPNKIPGIKIDPQQFVIYGQHSPGGVTEGSMFAAYTTKSKNSFAKGNAVFALGYQFCIDNPNVPQEILTFWDAIDDRAKQFKNVKNNHNSQGINVGNITQAMKAKPNYFSAFYVGTKLTIPNNGGSYNLKVSDWDAMTIDYNMYFDGFTFFTFRFDELYARGYGNYYFNPVFDIDIASSLKFKADIQLNTTLDVKLNGNDWYMDGKGDGKIEITTGGNLKKCNSASIKMKCVAKVFKQCIIKVPTGLKLKICADLNLDFKLQDGKAPKFNIHWN